MVEANVALGPTGEEGVALKPKPRKKAVKKPALVLDEEATPSFEPRKYVCARWPFLRLRNGLRFQNGILIAHTQEAASIVESNDSFGGSILRVYEKEKVESTPEKLDRERGERMEAKLGDILRKKNPRVHKGMVSTRNHGE